MILRILQFTNYRLFVKKTYNGCINFRRPTVLLPYFLLNMKYYNKINVSVLLLTIFFHSFTPDKIDNY